MNIFDRYKKPTWDLILEVLEDAYDEEEILDQELEGVLDDIYEDLLTEMEQLAAAENERDAAAEARMIRAAEQMAADKLTPFFAAAIGLIGNSMVNSYQKTATRTWEMFQPTIEKYHSSIPQLHMPTDFQMKVQIRDTNIWDKNIKIPWCADNKTYSDRLWSKVSRFQDKLNYVITTGIKKGSLSHDPAQKAGAMKWMNWAFKKLSHATAYEVARIIQTETMAMWSMATKEAYLSMGITYIEIINDSPCEEVCTDLVGEVIPLAEAEVSAELPPYHPNCKCEYIAWTEHVDGTVEEIEEFLD